MKATLLATIFGLSLACSSLEKTTYKGHGSESLPQEVLKKFAPQKSDSPTIKKIEALLDIHMPRGGVLTEDGKTLFFNWNVTGTNHVWRLSGPKTFPVQMTGGEDRTSVSSVSPDGRYIVVGRDEKGKEYPGLYWQSSKGGPLNLIFRKEKVQAGYQFITDDSRYVYYRANDQNPKRYNIYRYDMKKLKSELVVESGEGYWYVGDHKKNGDLLIANYRGNSVYEYFLFKASNKKLIPLLGQKEQVNYSMKFSNKKDEYIVKTNKFGEFSRLYLFKKGKFKALTKNEKFEVAWFVVDPVKGKILYQTSNKGYYDFSAISLNSFKQLGIRQFKEQNLLHKFFGRTTRNGRYSTVTLEKFNAPRVSYVYDWQKRSYTQWMLPSHPEIDVSEFRPSNLEYYKARDGVEIPMFVSRPSKCKKKLCPVIVRFHGGPEGQSIPRFGPLTNLYLEKGFVVVQPNVRGSTGYGKSWLHADDGPKRLQVITDIEDAALFIKKKWAKQGKSPKVGVLGGSYGGYSSFMAMTRFAGAYEAGVAVVGMSDLVSFLKNTAPYRRKLRIAEYGDPEKDLEALKKLSPINYLDKLQDPLLIIHGANDPRVPAGEAVQIFEAMEKRGLAGELILFEDEGHGIRRRKNKAIYLAKILDFFEKHLALD